MSYRTLTMPELQGLFPIQGYALLNAESNVYGDVRIYTLSVENAMGRKESIELCLPEPTASGYIDVDGASKVIIACASRGANYDLRPNSINNVWVSSPTDLLLHRIQLALSSALSKDGVDQDVINRKLGAFFSISPFSRSVDPRKSVDLQMVRSTVLIDTVKNPVDYRERIYEDTEGAIDLTTTPQGKYVGMSHQFVKGCKIKRSRIIPSNNIFSRSMEKYLVFPENDRPDRLLMARTVFARHEQVIKREDPMVCHAEYDGELNGLHLNTAIVSHPLNYYDCIVISQSAAKKLACVKRSKITHISQNAVLIPVTVGETVDPGDTVLIDSQEKRVVANVKHRAAVTSIESVPTRVGSKYALKYRIGLEEGYPMTDGDKLSSRHSTKGIVRIIPDEEMPFIDGKYMEALVHPRSFVGRRNFGAMREMMANKKAQELREKDSSYVFYTQHFSNKWSMESLVAEGYGKKVDNNYNEPIFWGPLYWLRTDKHAVDAFQYVGSTKPKTRHGIDFDSGKSGQRLGPDVAIIMEAKGLQHTLKSMRASSIAKETLSAFQEIVSCLS